MTLQCSCTRHYSEQPIAYIEELWHHKVYELKPFEYELAKRPASCYENMDYNQSNISLYHMFEMLIELYRKSV